MKHIFIHIHKSGGTTLINLLNRVYSNKKVYQIDGTRYIPSIEEFLLFDDAVRNSYELIEGHQFYGVHLYLEPKKYKYFAMLREPISRTISLYNYLKEINLYKEINQENMDIKTFINSKLALAADNGMTRFIGGFSLNEVPYGHISIEHAKKAIENINSNFEFVGLTKHFDLSIIAFKKILNWDKEPFYTKNNITKNKAITVENLTEEESVFLNNYLQPDLFLYKYIANNFFDRLKNILGEDYQNQEEIFKKKNKLYQSGKTNKTLFQKLKTKLFNIIKQKNV